MPLKILGSAGTSPSSGCPIYRVQCTECGDEYRRVGWPWDIKRQSHCVRCNGSSKRKPGTVNTRRKARRAELRKCPPVAAPRAAPAQEKACNGCHTPKPLTDFYRSKKTADGHQGMCKACDALRSANRGRGRSGERVGACKTGKICLLCGSMSHRVEGKRCRRCGLAFAEEAPPELELRRYDDIRARC